MYFKKPRFIKKPIMNKAGRNFYHRQQLKRIQGEISSFCNVYPFSSADADYLEIAPFTGNFKIILAATSETGIPAAIQAGLQGSFIPSTDPVNDPQWNQYEIDGAVSAVVLESTFTGVCGGYAKDDAWSYVNMGEPNPLMIAATNQRLPGTDVGTSGATSYRGRTPFQIGSGTLDSMVVSISNVGTTNQGEVLFSQINVNEAYIEDDDTGQLTAVKTGGSSSFVVAEGDPKHLCDEISASTLGYPDGIPNGKVFWYRYDYTLADGDELNASYIPKQVGGASGWYWDPNGTGVADPVNGTGPINKSGLVFGGSSSESHAPIILGRFKEARIIAAVAMGDSLCWGSNYEQEDAGLAGFGVSARSLYSDPISLADPIAGLVYARSGNTANDMMGTNTLLWTYFEHATHGYDTLGTNDVGANGGSTNPSTYSTLLSRKREIWQGMRDAGISKVATMMLLPNTTSTDGYATLENQTATSGWGVGGMVDDFRDTLLSQVGVEGGVDYCVRFDSVRWTAQDRWAWASEPANSYHWGDTLQDIATSDLRTFWLS